MVQYLEQTVDITMKNILMNTFKGKLNVVDTWCL